MISFWFHFYTGAGDQVSKKGGMTGGFYDYRRSKLKFMNIIKQNTRVINMKKKELEEVKLQLQDILLFKALQSQLKCSPFSANYFSHL